MTFLLHSVRADGVVIAGRSSVAMRDLGSMQDIDQLAAVRPLVKWARSAYRAERLPEYVAAAFRQAVSGRPGPAFLEVPIDIINREPARGTVRYPTHYRTRLRPQASGEGIREAAALLASAERPVILAGSGVWWSDAGAELTAFAEAAESS